MGSWGFGMIGLGDRVKVTKRGSRKDVGKVVKLPIGSNDVVVQYEDGETVTVRLGDTTKTRG